MCQNFPAKETYLAFADEFLRVSSSFCFLHSSDGIYAEEIQLYQFALPIKGHFLFPQSWMFQADRSPLKAGSSFVLMHSAKEDIIGHFTFVAVTWKVERTPLDL